jgi:hypothetical protein
VDARVLINMLRESSDMNSLIYTNIINNADYVNNTEEIYVIINEKYKITLPKCK